MVEIAPLSDTKAVRLKFDFVIAGESSFIPLFLSPASPVLRFSHHLSSVFLGVTLPCVFNFEPIIHAAVLFKARLTYPPICRLRVFADTFLPTARL